MRRGDVELKRQVDAALGALIADGTIARPWAAITCRIRPGQGGPAPRGRRHAEDPDVEAPVRRDGPHPIGRRAGGRPGPEQPPVLHGASVPGRAGSRDRRPAGRAARRLAAGVLGLLGARFVPLEAGEQAALRRDPRGHARRPVRAAGALFAAVPRRAVSRGRPAGEGRPSASTPMAVEQGVAVRGLEGRATHAYPSTEAVLEAVATGRERAGYVIATRGAWLAHERWPGKLELLPATATRVRHRRVPHRRGGAEDRRRPEGRHRPGLGRARPLGPARPGVRALAHPLRARRQAIARPIGKGDRSCRRRRREAKEAPGRRDRHRAGLGRLLAAAWRRPGRRRPSPPEAAAAGRRRAGGRPGAVPRAVQRLPRRDRARRQGPRPDRQQVAARRHRRRHRPHDPERRARDHDEEAGRRAQARADPPA